MAERKKLELELNVQKHLELLYDEPVVGQSKYGSYFLYVVKNGTGEEYSFFAPDEVHNEIKQLKKGNKFTIVKLAEQRGTKIITKHVVTIHHSEIKPQEALPSENIGNNSNTKDSYFEAMFASYDDAMKVQEKLNGMVDVNRIAITLFIARSKVNGGIYDSRN
jgi:hypothetical protein